MPYIGKKPADIIATAVDTTTGTFSGVVDADAGITVDNITIDGTEIDLSSGDLTIDVSGDINLDSDSGYVLFKDGGTEHARIFQNNSGDVNIGSQISDKDMKFLGNDGGVGFTALTLDMSEAGEATFNGDIRLNDGKVARFGTDQDFRIGFDGTDAVLQNVTSDSDITFLGKDGASTITALKLDMSEGGAATLNNGLTLTDGNLVVASGHGIDFGATANSSGTMSSELLDDYEEGTWEPSIGGDASYIHQSGTYVKIGRKVFLSCDIKINVIGTGVATQLNGAPFTAMNSGFPQGGISIMYYDAIATAVTSFNGYMNNNNAVITFSGNTGTAATTIGLNGFNVFKNSARVSFSIAYQTA